MGQKAQSKTTLQKTNHKKQSIVYKEAVKLFMSHHKTFFALKCVFVLNKTYETLKTFTNIIVLEITALRSIRSAKHKDGEQYYKPFLKKISLNAESR